MAINLNNTSDCCKPTCESSVVNTPGPQGPAGQDGVDGQQGAAGLNGYSLTTQPFTIPAPGIAENVVVDHTGWIADTYSADSQVVFIADAGHFLVSGKGTNHITVTTLNYDGDPGVAGAVVAANSVVAPAGLRGPAGADGDGAAGQNLTEVGDILTVTDGGITRLSIGSDNTQALFVDDTSGVGMSWRQPGFSDLTGQINFSTQVSSIPLDTGQLSGSMPLGNLASGGSSSGSLLYWNGNSWTPLASGSFEQILRQGVYGPEWVESVSVVALAKAHFSFDNLADSSPSVTVSSDYNIDVANISYGTLTTGYREITIPFSASLPSASVIVNCTGLNDDCVNLSASFRVGSLTVDQIVLRWPNGGAGADSPIASLLITE